MSSARNKFNLFIQARRDHYERKFLLSNPEPKRPPDVLRTLDLQAGGIGNAAIRATLEGPAYRAMNPKWYHDVAMIVHPDRVMTKLFRATAGTSLPLVVDSDYRRYHRCPIEVVSRWKRLSTTMMQEVNRLHDRGTNADGNGDDHDEPDKVSTLRTVLGMATEGRDSEMWEDFNRRHRHWNSVKTQYVGRNLDKAVARLSRESHPTVSETERKVEAMEEFVERVAVDIDPVREDRIRRGVDSSLGGRGGTAAGRTGRG